MTEAQINKLFEYLRKLNNNIANCSNTGTEYDHHVLCNPITGDPVVVVASYSGSGVPTFSFYNIDGTPYLGPTPVSCPGQNLESDPRQICVSGTTELTQWVVKDDGQPTGTVYYTDINGAIVPAPLPGTFIFGRCTTAVDTIVDGDLQFLNQSGIIIRNFTDPVDTVNVFNGTSDFVRVDVTFDAPILGNSSFYINPNGAQNIGRFIPRNIISVTITHLNTLNAAGGYVIVNGFSG